MDKTLADYIERTMKNLDKDISETKSNDLKVNQYKVYPEKQSVDSDEKINPYSPV